VSEGEISVGEFRLSTEPIRSTVSEFVREEGRVVDGVALIYNASGPRDLVMEIHRIELETGHRWVVAGEAFNGPKWVFGQLSGRLRISVNEKAQGHVLDLTIPQPGRRNENVYTASRTSVEDLGGVHPDMFTMLHDMGAREIGPRSDVIDDASTRKGFLCVLMDDPGCLVPVVAYFLTRTVAVSQEYERLLSSGAVEDESVSHYAERATQPAGPQTGGVESAISGGESAFVEFKPAIWYNHGRATNEPEYVLTKDSGVSDNIVRTVAGFLNAEGGQLFIGVGDDGSAYGLEQDVLLTSRKDMDGLENELTRLLTATISNEVFATKVRITFPPFGGEVIGRVEVEPADAPVFMKTNRHLNKFYVRIGNATNTMSVESAYNYISQHDWGGSGLNP